MKEEILCLAGSRLVHAGWRETDPYERDPEKLWLGSSQWYLNANGTITHEAEQISTIKPVDPSVLLYTRLIALGERTSDGHPVKSATTTWFSISNQLHANPNFRFEFCAQPTKFEEFLAGAHHIDGWSDVTLTPRSGDRGRDVIAEGPSRRLLEQAKAYGPGQLVTHNDVRAMFGVLCLDEVEGNGGKATRATVTSTADFCPSIAEEFASVMPHRLETRNGEQLVDWISGILTTSSIHIAESTASYSTQFSTFQAANKACERCGAIMISNGKRYLCLQCGNSAEFDWLPRFEDI